MSLFIHAGYAKAGSTFLQERVFSRHPGIHYLGKSREDYPDWLIRWHYADDLHFERHRDELRTTLDTLLSPDLPNVLSSEVFTMHGGHAAAQLRRIRTVAPEASLILMLRDPVARLLSFYRHLVQHDGLALPLEECLDWERTPFVFYKRKVAYLADSLYDELVDFARELFDGRVCVLRFEDMLERPDQFANDLGRFIGVSFEPEPLRGELIHRENTGVPESEIPRLRLENAVSALRPFAPGLAGSTTVAESRFEGAGVVSSSLRDRLHEFYRDRCQGYY